MSEKNDVRNCVLVILRSCVLVILVPWACFMLLVMLFPVWWIVKQIIIGPLICEQSTCPVQEHCLRSALAQADTNHYHYVA